MALSRCLAALFVVAAALAAHAAAALAPLPFTRPLRVVPSAPVTGNDVLLLQNLLARVPSLPPASVPPRTGAFGAVTAEALAFFQRAQGLSSSPLGELDNATAWRALDVLSDDGYQGLNATAASLGPYLYAVRVPVVANRSVELNATLYDAHGTELRSFRCRAHGVNYPGTQVALNQFAGNGVTPTGLAEFDLNSPEDDPKSFGPYPVNRFVRGLRGNMAVSNDAGNVTLVSDLRDGLLMHTGEWAGWNPSMPMPNSHGCVHCHPDDIREVWQILTTRLGVQVRNNTNGKLPYPYRPQGLVSVERADLLPRQAW